MGNRGRFVVEAIGRIRVSQASVLFNQGLNSTNKASKVLNSNAGDTFFVDSFNGSSSSDRELYFVCDFVCEGVLLPRSMDSCSDKWRWTDLPALDDEVSAVFSNVSVNAFSNDESGNGKISGSGASFVSRSTASGYSKGLQQCVAPSLSRSFERRSSVLSDVSSLSKSSVMGFDDLFDDDNNCKNKRPLLARWQSNDLLFDQSLFPSCPVRRSSLINNTTEGRQKPARWSSGQLLSMPPRPARKSSHSSLLSKNPSPNARELPSRRQMVKRAPSRVKSHGSMLSNKSRSSGSDTEVLRRCESLRWGSSEGSRMSSKHLPHKPTRRSSVFHDQTSPSSKGNKSVVSQDGSPSRNIVARLASITTALRSPKAQTNHSPQRVINSGQIKAPKEPVGRQQSPDVTALANRAKRSQLPGCACVDEDDGSGCGSIRQSSPKRYIARNHSDAKSSNTKTSDRSIASASVGSGLSMALSDKIAPALGKDVKHVRRWANSA
jgi:hypothetical protein